MINYLPGVLLSHPRDAVQIAPGAVLSQTPESLLRSFPRCGMTDIAMHDGAGSFAFADDAGGVRRTLRVFYFRPKAACINPEHLFLGTPKQNMADRMMKMGRRTKWE